MILSHTAEYALRTVAFLARRGDAPVRIDEIATALALPRNYLSKILYRLAQAGLLISSRGRGGGFRLARPADQLRLLDVITLFDQVGPERRCLLGREACNDRNPCEAHASWKEVAVRVAAYFSGTTVADLAASPGGRTRPVSR